MGVTAHLTGHFLLPLIFAWMLYRPRWRVASLVMISTMLVDLDHLLAHPVFDVERCSIGFHPLHSWPAIVGYGFLLTVPKARLVMSGLLIHMGVDGMDCLI